MPSKKKRTKPGMSDSAVAAKTGKTWAEWVRALDIAGAARMTHRQIAAFLSENLRVPSWWSQMVTVGYERLKGRREKGQTPQGYSVSASRTVGVPVARLFAAWNDARQRARWMRKTPMEITKATPNRSIRIRWGHGSSRVAVMFYVKGKQKSSVSVDHSRLASAAEAKKTKAYWIRQLDSLVKFLGA
jgi:hypothetical protein